MEKRCEDHSIFNQFKFFYGEKYFNSILNAFSQLLNEIMNFYAHFLGKYAFFIQVDILIFASGVTTIL